MSAEYISEKKRINCTYKVLSSFKFARTRLETSFYTEVDATNVEFIVIKLYINLLDD